METTSCQHKEQVERGVDGIEIGECTICHQVRRYNTRDLKENPVVTKLGRIDGKIVLPPPAAKLLLPAEEAAELKKATKAMASELVPQEPPPGRRGSTPPVSALVVPPRPRKRSLWDKYYEQNEEAILKDYRALTLIKFYKKWRLSSNTWVKLKELWGVKGKIRGPAKPRVQAEINQRTQRDQLPPFPPFNREWTSTVQEKWMEIYLELRKLEIEHEK